MNSEDTLFPLFVTIGIFVFYFIFATVDSMNKVVYIFMLIQLFRATR